MFSATFSWVCLLIFSGAMLDIWHGPGPIPVKFVRTLFSIGVMLVFVGAPSKRP